ncbi:MAG: winged helix-turn-helix domain-containing protein [Candidatus Wallbacteria bacterium]|nr:winged helix-turn-helix domain-containing protein [Candidatus Wallbacteria bacterium]
MKEKVGFAAGEIWAALKKENGATLNKIKSHLEGKGFSSNESTMALGWLLREDKIIFEEEKKGKMVNQIVKLKA